MNRLLFGGIGLKENKNCKSPPKKACLLARREGTGGFWERMRKAWNKNVGKLCFLSMCLMHT